MVTISLMPMYRTIIFILVIDGGGGEREEGRRGEGERKERCSSSKNGEKLII